FRVAFTLGSLPLMLRDPVIPVVSRMVGLEGKGSVAGLFESTSRWVYAYSAFVLGALWLLAPDLVLVWLGPGHERIAAAMWRRAGSTERWGASVSASASRSASTRWAIPSACRRS